MTSSSVRLRRFLSVAVTAAALFAVACSEKITGPREVGPDGRPLGRLALVAPMNGVQATTIVVEVAASDITPTMVFNLPVVSGTATGTIAVPAGANRQITVRAFDGQTETHRGVVTVSINAGTNGNVAVQLIPLQGDIPITVTFGTAVITITPITALQRVGDTLRYSAIVRDVNNTVQTVAVRWATTDTRKLTIDTLGLATMRDTGVASVVATYSTSAAVGTITIQPAVGGPVQTYLRTWVGGNGVGSQRTDWANANNWAPASVPTVADSVVLGAASFQPSIVSVDTFRVRDLMLRPGSNLTMNFRTLNVHGVLSGEGGGATSLGTFALRPLSTLRGVIPAPVLVAGAVSVLDSARVPSLTVSGIGASLVLAGKKLVVTGNAIVSTSATLAMTAAAETLDVGGYMQFQSNAGSHVGLLTNGTLIARGDVYGDRFDASGVHTLVMASTAPTTVQNFYSFNSATSALQNLTINNTPGVTLGTDLRVKGALRLLSANTFGNGSFYTLRVDSTFSSVLGSTITQYRVDLRHSSGTSLINGGFSPTFTDFNGVNQTIKAGLAYQNLGLYQSQNFADSVRTSGVLTIDGPSTAVTITPARRIVTGGVTLQNGGTINIDAAGDTLDVRGNLSTSGGGNSTGRLTAGVVMVTGNVDGTRYTGTGTNLLLLNGTGTGRQQLSGFNSGANPATGVQNLQVSNVGGVDHCSWLRINGKWRTTTAVSTTSCTQYGITVGDSIIAPVGSSISPYQISLQHPSGNSGALGNWSPTFTDVNIAGVALRPAVTYNNLRFFASASLPSGQTLTTTGDVLVDGAGTVLTLNGARLNVGADFSAQNNGRLEFVAGDTMSVNNTVTFNSGTATSPTGGQLSVGGAANLYGGYTPTVGGTHKLRLIGTTIRQDLYTTSGSVRKLEVANPFGLRITNNLTVTDSLVVSAAGPNAGISSNSSYTLQVNGPFIAPAQSLINVYAVNISGSSTLANVAGTFAPTITRLSSNLAGAVLSAPNLQYNNLEFYSSYTLTDSLRATGEVSVNNSAVLTFNGRKVVALRGFDLATNGSIVMTNPLDSLVAGDGLAATQGVLFDGGAASTISAGTIIVRGGNNYFTQFAPTGTNRVIFSDSAATPATRQFNINGNANFRRMIVSGYSSLTVFFTGQTNTVSDSLILRNGTLTSYNTAYGVSVDGGGSGQLVMTNGAITTMYVNLYSATGTAYASGGYAPGLTRFYAANATMNPAITYQSVEQYGNMSLTGTTNVTGSFFASTAAVLTLNGRRMNVGGSFNQDVGAVLTMVSPADTLDVSGDLNLDSGANGTFTNGVILFRGTNFIGTNYITSDAGSARFRFLGTVGTGQQTLGANPRFRRLDIGGTRGVFLTGQFPVVTDSMVVSAAVPVLSYSTSYGLDITGPLTTAAGSSFSALYVRLRDASGTTNVNSSSAFSPGVLYMGPGTGPDTLTLKPGLPYVRVEIQTHVRLSGAVTTTGPVVVAGGTNPRLTLNNNTLRIGGSFQLGSGGVLVMNNPTDSLITTGPAASADFSILSNAGVNTSLTAGVVVSAGDISIATANGSSSGTHKYILSRDDASQQSVTSSNIAMQSLEIAGNGSRTISFNSAPAVPILGNLTVSSPGAAILLQNLNSSYPVTVGGVFSTTVNTTVNFTAPLTVTNAAGLTNVLGPTSLSNYFVGAGPAQTIPTATRFTYGNLTINPSASATFATSPNTVRIGSGALGTINVGAGGTLTNPTGNTVTACGTINGTGTLNNAGTANTRATTSLISIVSGPAINTNTFPGC